MKKYTNINFIKLWFHCLFKGHKMCSLSIEDRGALLWCNNCEPGHLEMIREIVSNIEVKIVDKDYIKVCNVGS